MHLAPTFGQPAGLGSRMRTGVDQTDEVAIIGAGMTGIACARVLVQAGRRVRLFDKGRGIGGRMATRITRGGLRFDHGAQVLPAPRDAGLATALADLATRGDAASWGDAGLVGVPGMSAIPAALAQGLTVTQGVAINRLQRRDGRWHLGGEGVTHQADSVVLSIPAPQARDLLGRDHAFADALAQVRYLASVTLMAGLALTAPRPFARREGSGMLSWIAQDADKPGRQGQPLTTWIAQADSDWSAAHIDLPFDDLAAKMAPALTRELGAAPGDLVYSAAHRWLYARTDRALGRAFLGDAATRLAVGGDWALGPLAEHGWASGTAMGEWLLDQGA